MTQLKRVAIIGAGPGGLSMAKAIKMEQGAFEVEIYERKKSIGGAWFYDGDLKALACPSVPSTDPNGSDILKSTGKQGRSYVSPLYQKMETNLIDTLMEFKDVPYEPRLRTFRLRSDVLNYLKKYASTIPGPVHYRLQTSVEQVFKEDSKWIVESLDISKNECQRELYDYVVVANGHNEHPYVPDVTGLNEWSETDRLSVTHSKYYVDAKPFTGKNVLVVGNYASGGDLATQIGVVAKKVYVSTTAEVLPESKFEQIEYYPVVEKYDVSTRSAVTKGGQIIKDIDHIIFCTGYSYSLPFLENQFPGITDGLYIKNLYRQMFFTEDPSLVFVGVNKFVSPFPLCETQASIIARVFSGRIQLPEKSFLQESYRAEIAAKGAGKSFHNLIDADYTYCNELYELILYTKTDKEGLLPRYWDEEFTRDRIGAPKLKATRFDYVKENAQKLRKQGKHFDFPENWL